MQNLIIRLNDSNSLQQSPQDQKIVRLVSSISPFAFINLLRFADNKVNPRSAKINPITKEIFETLDKSPELFWYKSKGILIATESCKLLDRNRVEISFNDSDYEGIMDGGHNCLAIAIFLVKKIFNINLKNWEDCKLFWESNHSDILAQYKLRKDEFDFSIPVEIITPSDEDGALEFYYDTLSEICSARNNNVQLNETAKANQVGSYENLKDILTGLDIIWKTGDKGKIKAEDVISLAAIPLMFLANQNILPNHKSLNKISLYSQKSKCVDYFNTIVQHKDISKYEDGKYEIENQYVKSALTLTKDILEFFDSIYLNFPELYHNASPGKFGRISSVDNNHSSKVPFLTTEELCDYKYPFGFIYPIIAGLTELMQINKKEKTVTWITNPNELDLFDLDFAQYVNIIKLVNFDPQKVGKGEVFYKEAETIFQKST